MRFALYYFSWHYHRGLFDFTRNWTNILWAVWHLCAIPYHLKNLFTPWRRLHESYVGSLNLSGWGQTLIVNMLSRIVGFLVRMVTVVLGLVVMLFIALFGGILYLAWVGLPIVLPLLFFSGVLFLLG